MEKKQKTPANESVVKWILKNIIGATVAVLAIALVSSFALGFITHHGQENEVPDFTNMSVPQAVKFASEHNMRIEVTDSVYVRKMARGAVYSQNPKAGSKVKNGRRILVTINSVVPKKVKMPDLVGFSLRQARAELTSRGLQLGKLIYEEDIATNNVLKQNYRGKPVKAGSQIESGATVDLVVGLNPDDNETFVPDVSGMKFMRAKDAIHDNSLNVGRLFFDKTVTTYADSLDAVVTKQVPEASSELPILMGSDITLYLTKPGE